MNNRIKGENTFIHLPDLRQPAVRNKQSAHQNASALPLPKNRFYTYKCR